MHNTKHNNTNNNEDAAAEEILAPLAFNQLTRSQQRLLEDLESELLIPSSRRDAEIADANNDTAVTAVRTSGVANRRPLHFDGIKDLPLTSTNDADNADDTDDDGAIIAVGQQHHHNSKMGGSRRGRPGENGSNNNNNNNQSGPAKPAISNKISTPLDVATAAQLAKLAKQIPELLKELVECSGQEDIKRKTEIKVHLTRMRNEVSQIRQKAEKSCVQQG